MNGKTLVINKTLSDEAILVELGRRLSRHRIDAKLTQQALAEMSGISKSTLERIEAGAPSQLPNLIRVLRVLDMLPTLDHAIPAPAPRPMALLRNQRKPPQRVRPRQTPASAPDQTDRSETGKPWVWGDERQ
ncbi:helix-turn-helix transcriptional regulator [Pseudohongiella sp.]|uniref:HTH cro/C1-type domain-containing protein n=1 Tax=marine sediment metagenome TaxID=412755 RepID=A0A0F9W941_9ZZZZ|nr:helix-turn-helix transcriptional regulator [Pseudohongiella sp.]HDZ08753.1 XRE family transcriptional regulator [Pseudohongiella sp.]HEA62369.1 XRE family transcriptional regulator [Pseudohongiella sp.]